jgi:hypothetical protein
VVDLASSRTMMWLGVILFPVGLLLVVLLPLMSRAGPRHRWQP